MWTRSQPNRSKNMLRDLKMTYPKPNATLQREFAFDPQAAREVRFCVRG